MEKLSSAELLTMLITSVGKPERELQELLRRYREAQQLEHYRRTRR